MFKGLIGKKIGMTQIFDENGAAVPVRATVAEAAPRFAQGVDLLRVEDGNGATAGALHRDDVVDMRGEGRDRRPVDDGGEEEDLRRHEHDITDGNRCSLPSERCVEREYCKQ